MKRPITSILFFLLCLFPVHILANPGDMDYGFHIGATVDANDVGSDLFKLALMDIDYGLTHLTYVNLPLHFGFGGGSTLLQITPGLRFKLKDLEIPLLTPYWHIGLGGYFLLGKGDDAGLGIRGGGGVNFSLQETIQAPLSVGTEININVIPVGFKDHTPVAVDILFGIEYGF